MVINLDEYNIVIRNSYYIYDSNGTFIQEFDSAKDCIIFLDTDSANLNRATKGNYKIKGYFITTEKVDKLTISSISRTSKKLNRYTLDGKYIDSFNSASEAKEKLGLKLTSLSSAIKLNRQCNGYRWTRDDNPSMIIEVPIHNNSKKAVEMYDLNGNLIETFESMAEANRKYCGCIEVLKGRCKTSHGYIFKYK